MPNDLTSASGATPGYVLDDQIGFILRQAAQRHSVIFQKLSPYDLTPTQFAVLIRLHQMGECSQNELGRRTAMDVATIKGVVDRLRRKGFLNIRPDPQDRRRTLLSISETYKDIAPALHEAGTDITAATLDPLAPAERKELLRLLRKISD
ncbi:MarR family winged helix-turn-helix transcriptional regulator [Paracoccus sp. (in: a-proteobacteria)]|uniref:MarR family winged helix-turn-helix transcriptional regulator n=1 Tax=Paracoccus sp. TaxID=267 RepID=UPI003A8C5EE8